MCERHLSQRPALAEQVHRAPVREVGHGQAGDLPQRGPLVRERGRRGAGLGEEPGVLLGPLAIVDVGGGAETPEQPAPLVSDRYRTDQVPSVRPGVVAQAVLALEPLAQADGPVPRPGEPGEVVRAHDPPAGLHRQVFFRPPRLGEVGEHPPGPAAVRHRGSRRGGLTPAGGAFGISLGHLCRLALFRRERLGCHDPVGAILPDARPGRLRGPNRR